MNCIINCELSASKASFLAALPLSSPQLLLGSCSWNISKRSCITGGFLGTELRQVHGQGVYDGCVGFHCACVCLRFYGQDLVRNWQELSFITVQVSNFGRPAPAHPHTRCFPSPCVSDIDNLRSDWVIQAARNSSGNTQNLKTLTDSHNMPKCVDKKYSVLFFQER